MCFRIEKSCRPSCLLECKSCSIYRVREKRHTKKTKRKTKRTEPKHQLGAFGPSKKMQRRNLNSVPSARVKSLACAKAFNLQRSNFTVVRSSQTTGFCVGRPRGNSLVVRWTTKTVLLTGLFNRMNIVRRRNKIFTQYHASTLEIVGILPSSGDDGVAPCWVGVGSAASAEVAV